MTIHRLGMNSIVLDERAQSRRVDPMTVQAYTDDLLNGAVFPPPIVFHDGNRYIMADGFMRYFAHKNVGATTIDCDVRIGDMRAAKLFSCTANLSHGLRAHDDDRDAAILTMAESGIIEGQIAIQTNTSAPHVRKVVRAGRPSLPTKSNGVTEKTTTDSQSHRRVKRIEAYNRWCSANKLPAASDSTFKTYIDHLRSEQRTPNTIYTYLTTIAANLRQAGVVLPTLRQVYPELDQVKR